MTVEDFKILLDDFLALRISAEELQRTYLKIFRLNDTVLEEDQFLTLDQLFFEVLSYSDDPELFVACPGQHINENELRTCVEMALQELGTGKDR